MKTDKCVKTRRLSIVLGVLFLAGLLINSSYALYAVDPIGEWHFDENKGKTAEDSSENDHDATLMGDTQWTDGNFGAALELDGVDDYVQMSCDGLPDEYTLSIWVYPTAEDSIEGYGRTVLSSSQAASNYGFWLLAVGRWRHKS